MINPKSWHQCGGCETGLGGQGASAKGALPPRACASPPSEASLHSTLSPHSDLNMKFQCILLKKKKKD